MMRIVVLFLAAVCICHGQRGRVDIRGDFGWESFLDEGGDNHVLVGASFVTYLSRRISLQPEFQYLRRTEGYTRGHYDLGLLTNVAFDLRSPTSRIVPYLIIGPGLLYSHDVFFSHTDFYISGGGGVKIFVGEKVYVAPDFRIGWEPHIRFSVGVGYAFAR